MNATNFKQSKYIEKKAIITVWAQTTQRISKYCVLVQEF